MDAALRPYGLGATQYYVLHHLIQGGPTMQRELVRLIQIDRATMSVVIGALVKKGLVEQLRDRVDLRQKRVQITPSGNALWERLPDLGFINEIAFGGIDNTDLETALRVIQLATERLENHARKEWER